MEMTMFEIISTGLCGVLLILVWRGFESMWLRPKKLEKCLREQGFSGNSYRVLVGDMRESSKKDQEAHAKPINLDADICPRVMPFIHHTVQKYGKNCFTWMGPYPNIIVMDPEMLREILTKHKAWPKPLHVHPLAKVISLGLVRLEGEKWAKDRKFLNPAFSRGSLKNDMFPFIHLSCKEMLKEWEIMASPTGSVELDSWPYCCGLSCEMLARAVFGNNSYKDGLEIFKLQRETTILAMQALQSVYIPGSQYFPTKFNRRLKGCKREVHRRLKDKIEEKEKEIAEGGDESKDLISFILVSNSKLVKEQGKEYGLTLDEIIDHCEEFFEGGESAASSLFVWTLVMLSKHQDWQDKARDEIHEVFGDKEPDFDGISRLNIVTMIINEVLRLYSPAYFTMRSTKQEMKLQNLTIPAGIFITLPFLLVHRDPDLWGNNAGEFNPQRFSNGVAAATNERLSFLPFSTGPRTCIGYQFAMLQGKLLVATLLQRFSLHLSPAYVHTPFAINTTRPQHGARLIIRKL